MQRRARAGADEDDVPERPSPADDDGGGVEPDTRFRLALRDLIPGSSREVVLFNDSAVREVVIESDRPPVEEGETATRVTGDGVDVSGFRYLRFADGLTLFHAPDTCVRVDVDAVPD
jgi:hypothetical protein